MFPAGRGKRHVALKIAVALGLMLGSGGGVVAADDVDPDEYTCVSTGGSGDYVNTVIAACDRALATGNRPPEKLSTIYQQRGQAYKQKGDLEAALRDYEKAAELDPKNASVIVNLGFFYLDRKDFDRSRSYFDKAIELEPKYGYEARAQLFVAKGQYDSALADLDKVIELNAPHDADPEWGFNNALAYADRCSLHILRKDYKNALADCDKAISLNPKDEAAHIKRADIRRLSGDTQAALADLAKAFELKSPLSAVEFWGRAARGKVYEAMGDKARAIEDYRAAIANSPGDFRAAREEMADITKRLTALEGTAVGGQAPASGTSAAPDSSSADQLYWQSVKDSQSVEELESYLAKFPNGTFAELARLRIKRLRGGSDAAPAAAAPLQSAGPAATPQDTGAQAYTGENAWFGVIQNDLNAEDARRLKLPGTKGSLITGLQEGGPAQAAGLRVDDVILKVDGTEIVNQDTIIEIFDRTRPGATLRLTVWRDAAETQLEVHVRSNPAGWLGITVGLLGADRAAKAQRPVDSPYVYRLMAGSPAVVAGLKQGDVLLAIDGVPVPTTSSVYQALLKAGPGAKVSLKILREDKEQTVEVQLVGKAAAAPAAAPPAAAAPKAEPAGSEPGAFIGSKIYIHDSGCESLRKEASGGPKIAKEMVNRLTSKRMGNAAWDCTFVSVKEVEPGRVWQAKMSCWDEEEEDEWDETDTFAKEGSGDGFTVKAEGDKDSYTYRLCDVLDGVLPDKRSSAPPAAAPQPDPAATQKQAAPAAGSTYNPQRAWLGIYQADLNEDNNAQKLGLTLTKGTIITGTMEASPAKAAGLRYSDVILKLNGAEVANSDALIDMLGRMKAGDTAVLSIWRDNHEEQVSVELAVHPLALLGVRLGEKTSDAWPITGIEASSPAEQARLKVGDVLHQIEAERLRSLDNIYKLLREAGPGAKLDLAIVRDGNEQKIEVQLPGTPPKLPDTASLAAAQPPAPGEERGWLGANCRDLTAQERRQAGQRKDSKHEYCIVTDVDPNGPAARAHLKVGNVITHVPGFELGQASARYVAEAVAKGRPGQTFEITILDPSGRDLFDFRKPVLWRAKGSGGEPVSLPPCVLETTSGFWKAQTKWGWTYIEPATALVTDNPSATASIVNLTSCSKDCDIDLPSRKLGLPMRFEFAGLQWSGRPDHIVAAERVLYRFKREDNGQTLELKGVYNGGDGKLTYEFINMNRPTDSKYEQDWKDNQTLLEQWKAFLAGEPKVRLTLLIDGKPAANTTFDMAGYAAALANADRQQAELRRMVNEKTCDAGRAW